jgi:hypothetical protein
MAEHPAMLERLAAAHVAEALTDLLQQSPAEVVREKCEAALLSLSLPINTSATAAALASHGRGGGGAAMVVAPAYAAGEADSTEPALSNLQTGPLPSAPGGGGGGGGGGAEVTADLQVLSETLQRRAAQRQKRGETGRIH